MSIAIVAPQKYDFQDLVCIELMLRFEGDASAILKIEPDGGEDAELSLTGSAGHRLIEIQVKGAAAEVTLDDVASFLSHCPGHSPSESLFERLAISSDRLALIVVSGRCDDATSKFVVPVDWDGERPKTRGITQANAKNFLSAFSKSSGPSVAPLAAKRAAVRQALATSLAIRVVQDVLERVLILERVSTASLETSCAERLRSVHLVPGDRIADAINRLRTVVKKAKEGKFDVFSPMRRELVKIGAASIRPPGYVERGGEAELADTLSRENVLLLSGPPRCGKSDTARWIAAGFQKDGYDVREGVEVGAAARFLRDPGRELRLFVLDDPLGGSHMHPEAGRMLELLRSLISRLPDNRKIIVSQSQENLLASMRRSELSQCAVAGHAWNVLGHGAPLFLARLWEIWAAAADVPAGIRERMADALRRGEVQLEAGCLRHLASAGGQLSDAMTLDRATRLARETAEELGFALAEDEQMESTLVALAIATGPSEPVDLRELAFVSQAVKSLPGRRSSKFSVVRIGGPAPEAEQPLTYDVAPVLDPLMDRMLESLERRGMIRISARQVVFSHAFYRAASESIVRNPSMRSAERALSMLVQGLFCLASTTSRASARNLDWLHEALSTRPDSAPKVLLHAIAGLESIFPATRDICFSFLVRAFDDLDPSQREQLPGWARRVAHLSLSDLVWENGQARFPLGETLGSTLLDFYLSRVERSEVADVIAALDAENAVAPTPERVSTALRYFSRKGRDLSKRAAQRLLAYDEAIIRSESVRIWLKHDRSGDDRLLTSIFEDHHPIVARASLSGVCAGWGKFSEERRERLLQGLSNLAGSPAAAIVLLDRLVLFDRVEEFGKHPPWPLFERLLPIVLAAQPSNAGFRDERLFSVARSAVGEISPEAFEPICESWIGWLEREIADDRLPGEYAFGMIEIMLDATRSESAIRNDLVIRLFRLKGTGALIAVVRDFVDSWDVLSPGERHRLLELLGNEAPDRRWLQAVAITRSFVPTEVQSCVLADDHALEASADVLVQNLPQELLTAALQIFCGSPGLLWSIGTHHSRAAIWESVVELVARRSEHPGFEMAVEFLSRTGDGARLVGPIEAASTGGIPRMFELLLRDTVTLNNYFSPAWSALMRRCPDDDTRRLWLSRLAECAPAILDHIGDLRRWLANEEDRTDMIQLLQRDVGMLLFTHELQKISTEVLQETGAAVAEMIGELLTSLHPRLFGTFDAVQDFLQRSGISSIPLDTRLADGRDAAFKERERLQSSLERPETGVQGWIGPGR